jgi:N4-gp56 family major capsid protein
LYQLAQKRKLPRNFGKIIHFTRYFKAGAGSGHVIPFAVTEGTSIGLSALSAAAISATIAGYASAIGVSDFIVMTGVSDVVKGAVFELSKGMALKIERQCRTTISATGTILPARNTATLSSSLIGTTSTIKAIDIMRAVAALRQGDARAWPDNHFAAIVHPRVGFDLRNDTTAVQGWGVVNSGTAEGQRRMWQGEIGTLYGARIIESSEAKQLLPTTASLYKISAGASGFATHVIAPGAFGVVELDGNTASVFVKQVGSAGSADPVNQKGSIGIKAYFVPVVLEAGRMKRIPSGGRTL